MKKASIFFFVFTVAIQTYSQQNQNPMQTVCAGSTENYNVTTTLTGSTFNWTITPATGGTIIGNGNNINIQWGTTVGTYTVQVIETSANNCLGPAKTVTVTLALPPTANAGSNQIICAQAGQNITLSGASVSNTTSQSWITSGTGILTNNTSLAPSYTITTADLATGSINFILTANGTSPCTNATDTITYTLIQAPTLAVGNNGPVCETNTLNLTSNIPGATYSWSGPNGYMSTSQNPTVSPSAATSMSGTYTLIVSNIPNGCPNLTGNTSVVINPIPNTSPIWHD